MSNFNGNSGSFSELTDGSANIFVNSVKINDISTQFPLKVNLNKQVVAEQLTIADTAGLQDAIDSIVTNSDSLVRSKSIVRFDGNSGTIIQGYTNNSLAPIISDDGFMTVYNNFNQEREDASGLSVQSIYGDQPYYSGAMDFRSYTAKSNADNISNNRVIGRVQFMGGSAPSNRNTGCRLQAKAIQDWTEFNLGTEYVIQTIKKDENIIEDRLIIDENGDVLINNNVVAQDLYVSGTRNITPLNSNGVVSNELNYNSNGISVANSLLLLTNKSQKLDASGNLIINGINIIEQFTTRITNLENQVNSLLAIISANNIDNTLESNRPIVIT